MTTEQPSAAAEPDAVAAGGRQPSSIPARPVTVVGAGMAGSACAVALRSAGIPVTLIERGRAVGGRMASPQLHGRRVDIGAGYFTVRDSGFAALVQGWRLAGLAHPWTDTFAVLAASAAPDSSTGPMRWSTPAGLRSLVDSLLRGAGTQAVEPLLGESVDRLPAGEVVLAMPDPQAARLIAVPDAVANQPVIAVVAGYAARHWSFEAAAFVNGHPDIAFMADDGHRRGDGAPVLVVHTTADRARRHLDDPQAAVEPVIGALRELLGGPEPVWTHPHRWTFAQPADRHPTTHGRVDVDGRAVWLAGDQWCPDGSPRVESAWRSGTDVAAAILAARSTG